MSKQKKTYNVGNAPAQQQVAEKSSLMAQKIAFMTILLLLVAVVLVATIIYANYVAPTLKEKTNTAKTLETSSATIRNGGFDFVIPSSQNVVGYPYIASNWTLTRDSNVKTVAGVLPVADETWTNVASQLSALGVSVSNPGEPEDSAKNDDKDTNSVYMISNIEDTYASIKNYSSFSVSSNSYNKITLWVKTVEVEQSDVYIWLKKSSSSTTPVLSFSDVVTNGEWTEYSFYVEGSDTSSTTLYVEIGLGQKTTDGYDIAKGVVFIDDIVINSTSKGEYLKMKDTTSATMQTTSFFTEDDTENIASVNVGNAFETISADDYVSENLDENGEPALFPFAVGELSNVNVYKLHNDGTTKSKGGTLIQPFTVSAPSISDHYRLSFYVRTKDIRIDQGANFYLYVDGQRYNTAYTTYFSGVRTTEEIAEDTFNGWVQYSFYVKPSNTTDFTMQLEVWLGKMVNGENIIEPVTGTLYIADIELNKISLSTYASASTNAFTKKTDLSSTTFTPTSTTTLTNGSFETLPTNTSSAKYPYAASSWKVIEQYGINSTLTQEDGIDLNINDVDYGIISSQNADNTNLGINNATDFVFGNSDTINQFYIRNNKLGGTAFGIQSTKITLAANSYTHISVIAKEINGGKAYAYITGDISGLSANGATANESDYFIPTNELEYDNGFIQYHFYIATGEVAKTVYLELYNGEKPVEGKETVKTNGIVVFDLADYATMTEDEFKALTTVDSENPDYNPPFESYETEEESYTMQPLFNNVKGLDLSNEKAVVRGDDPVDKSEDTEDDEALEINWVTLLVSLASLLMVAAIIVVIIVLGRRKRLAAQKAKEIDEFPIKKK